MGPSLVVVVDDDLTVVVVVPGDGGTMVVLVAVAVWPKRTAVVSTSFVLPGAAVAILLVWDEKEEITVEVADGTGSFESPAGG